MSDVQKKFYVLRAISGKENKVREYLEAELKNTDLGDYVSQVLIPTEKTYTVRNGKKVMKERAYLPGYVLVEATLVGEVAHRLCNIPNVIGFLGGSETPVPLRVYGNWQQLNYSLQVDQLLRKHLQDEAKRRLNDWAERNKDSRNGKDVKKLLEKM